MITDRMAWSRAIIRFLPSSFGNLHYLCHFTTSCALPHAFLTTPHAAIKMLRHIDKHHATPRSPMATCRRFIFLPIDVIVLDRAQRTPSAAARLAYHHFAPTSRLQRTRVVAATMSARRARCLTAGRRLPPAMAAHDACHRLRSADRLGPRTRARARAAAARGQAAHCRRRASRLPHLLECQQAGRPRAGDTRSAAQFHSRWPATLAAPRADDARLAERAPRARRLAHCQRPAD